MVMREFSRTRKHRVLRGDHGLHMNDPESRAATRLLELTQLAAFAIVCDQLSAA